MLNVLLMNRLGSSSRVYVEAQDDLKHRFSTRCAVCLYAYQCHVVRFVGKSILSISKVDQQTSLPSDICRDSLESAAVAVLTSLTINYVSYKRFQCPRAVPMIQQLVPQGSSGNLMPYKGCASCSSQTAKKATISKITGF
jgi:hypothetical protein